MENESKKELEEMKKSEKGRLATPKRGNKIKQKIVEEVVDTFSTLTSSRTTWDSRISLVMRLRKSRLLAFSASQNSVIARGSKSMKTEEFNEQAENSSKRKRNNQEVTLLIVLTLVGDREHYSKTPEITYVLAATIEGDEAQFMEDANPSKKSMGGTFLGADTIQDGGNSIDLWGFDDLAAMVGGSF
ncbi:hypothetical protein LguiB_003408 [Lonicera macranthoides]